MRRLRSCEALRRASEPGTGPEDLAQLAYHTNPAVRLAVAEHANTSPETRRLLADDPVDVIRYTVDLPESLDEVAVVPFGGHQPNLWWTIVTAVAVGVIAAGTVLYFVLGHLLARSIESALKG